MILWHIYTLACMINAPTDCFEQNLPRTYQNKIQCERVITDPFGHLDEIPLKVMGAKWVKFECRGERH